MGSYLQLYTYFPLGTFFSYRFTALVTHTAFFFSPFFSFSLPLFDLNLLQKAHPSVTLFPAIPLFPLPSSFSPLLPPTANTTTNSIPSPFPGRKLLGPDKVLSYSGQSLAPGEFRSPLTASKLLCN